MCGVRPARASRGLALTFAALPQKPPRAGNLGILPHGGAIRCLDGFRPLTIRFECRFGGRVAQGSERFLDTEEVRGSSPRAPTSRKFRHSGSAQTTEQTSREGNSLLDRFLLAQQVEEGKAPTTVQNYRWWLRPFILWVGDRDPLTLTADDVQEHVAGLFREVVNPFTRQSRVKALKLFFAWLHRRKFMPENPAAAIKTPQTPDEVPYILRVDQVDALRRACRTDTFEGIRNRAMLEVAFDCGLRSIELRRLHVSDVDWRERTLRVEGKGRPRKPASVRHVPFSVTVTRTLKRYLDARNDIQGDVLFVDRHGLGLTRRNMGLIIERLRKHADLQAVRGSWHDLRHAFTTEMLRGGCSEEHLRRMLGHKDRRMLQRYSHLLTADLRRAHDQFSPADRLLRD
jgi:integrase/recombinase XerD